MRWRLILEEYGVSHTYVKGITNIVAANVLSNLSQLKDINFHTAVSDNDLTDKIFLNQCADDALIYPFSFNTISKAQQNDTDLYRKLRTGMSHLQPKPAFCGGAQVICQDGLIYVPKALQVRVKEFYHLMLCHSGTTHTEENIKQHLTLPESCTGMCANM